MKILTSATRVTLLILVVTLCLLTLLQYPIPEQFNSVVLTVVAFFFGSKGTDSTVNKPIAPVVQEG